MASPWSGCQRFKRGTAGRIRQSGRTPTLTLMRRDSWPDDPDKHVVSTGSRRAAADTIAAGRARPLFTRFTGSAPEVATRVFAPVKLLGAALVASGLAIPAAGIAGAAIATGVCALYLIRLAAPGRCDLSGIVGFAPFGSWAVALIVLLILNRPNADRPGWRRPAWPCCPVSSCPGVAVAAGPVAQLARGAPAKARPTAQDHHQRSLHRKPTARGERRQVMAKVPVAGRRRRRCRRR